MYHDTNTQTSEQGQRQFVLLFVVVAVVGFWVTVVSATLLVTASIEAVSKPIHCASPMSVCSVLRNAAQQLSLRIATVHVCVY